MCSRHICYIICGNKINLMREYSTKVSVGYEPTGFKIDTDI